MFSDSLVEARSGSRFATLPAQTPLATANIPLIVSVWFTTCPTKRRMALSKCAIVILWMFLECIPRVDKHCPTPSLPSLLVRSHRFLTRPVSLPARTVKRIRVLHSTPTSSISPPRPPPHLVLKPQVLLLLAVVLAQAVRLLLLLLANLTAQELSPFHFSRPSLASHSPLLSLRNCMCLM